MSTNGTGAEATLLQVEDLSIEFTRLLGAAQEGGSTVAECCVTASRIDLSDDQQIV